MFLQTMGSLGTTSSYFYNKALKHLRLFSYIIFFILFSTLLDTTSALRNITITSDHPSIHYRPVAGAWTTMGDSRATHGIFKLARTQDAFASITRNFRTMHFVSPLWPFPILVRVSVDNLTQIIDLQDYTVPPSHAPPQGFNRATQSSQVIWTFHGVDKGRTVRVSVGTLAVLDNLIFEVAEPGDPPVIVPGSQTTSSYPQATSPATTPLIQTVSQPYGPNATARTGQPSTKQDQTEKSNALGVIAIVVAICVPFVILALGGLVLYLILRKWYGGFGIRRMRSSARMRGAGLCGDSEAEMSPLREEEVVMWPKKGAVKEMEPMTKPSFYGAYSKAWSLKAPYAVTTPVLEFPFRNPLQPYNVAAIPGDDPTSPFDDANAYTERESSEDTPPSDLPEMHIPPETYSGSHIQLNLPPTSSFLPTPKRIPSPFLTYGESSMSRASHTSHIVIQEVKQAHVRDPSALGGTILTISDTLSSRSATIDSWTSFGNSPLRSPAVESNDMLDHHHRGSMASDPMSPLRSAEIDNDEWTNNYPSTQLHEGIPGYFVVPRDRVQVEVPVLKESRSAFDREDSDLDVFWLL